MTTAVYVWNSYSCNNSSDFRLIAEFDSPKKAESMAKELVVFFKAHAKEADGQVDAPGFDWPGKGTDVAREFGKKYGHTWKSYLLWGDDCLEGDEPEVTTVGKNLVLYHSYMGGFGDDLPKLLKSQGAKLTEDDGPPVLYGEVTFGKKGTKLADELAAFFAQAADPDSYPSDWKPLAGTKMKPTGDAEEHLFERDGDRASFIWPIGARDIPDLRKHLEAHADVVSLRLAAGADLKAFAKRAADRAKKEAAEAKKAARSSPQKKIDVRMARKPETKGNGALFCGAAVADGALYLAGGLGKDICLRTRDGKKFEALKTPCRGLRAIHVEGSQIWVVGEYGTNAHSSNGGKTFKKGANLGSACLFSVARGADGSLWICDDGGQFWKSGPKGGAFEKSTKVKKDVAVIEPSAIGLLCATDVGLYVIKKDKPQKTSLTDHVRHAIETPAGTILAVGNQGLYRSTDKAKTFTKVKMPITVPLTYAAVTPSGHIVIVADKSKVIHSFDDGQTFREIKENFKTQFSSYNSAQALYCVKAFGEDVYIGGDYGTVYRISTVA